MTIAALQNSEGQFSGNSAENTIKHRDGSIGSVAANHRGGGESSVVVTTLGALSETVATVSLRTVWSFWALFPHFAAQSNDSHLNAASFDCVNAWRVSPVSHTAHPPPRVRFPTPHSQTKIGLPGQQGQSRHCTE